MCFPPPPPPQRLCNRDTHQGFTERKREEKNKKVNSTIDISWKVGWEVGALSYEGFFSHSNAGRPKNNNGKTLCGEGEIGEARPLQNFSPRSFPFLHSVKEHTRIPMGNHRNCQTEERERVITGLCVRKYSLETSSKVFPQIPLFAQFRKQKAFGEVGATGSTTIKLSLSHSGFHGWRRSS